MTVIWLIVWLLKDTPHILENPAWITALLVCAFIDLA